MADLRVNIAGVPFKNPVIAASGAYGFGEEYLDFYPLSALGGISCKGTTLHKRLGNPAPRIAETPSGILNSVGLQNPGVDVFVAEELPWLLEQDVTVIANVAGSCVADYCETVEKLSDTGVHMIELNISCPNVKEGGVNFGTSCASVEDVTNAVRRVCKKPLMVKLTPNVSDIAEIAKAAEAGGADALSLINTITGMRIDIRTRRPILRNNTGGMSGPCVFPVAVRMVNQVYGAVKVPVVGLGGIATWQDAVEMMLAGASAIQIGTAMFADAYAPVKILDGLEQYLEEQKIKSVTELTGKVELW